MKVVTIDDDTEFIILASDGIWKVVTFAILVSHANINSIEIQSFSCLADLVAGYVKPRSSGRHKKHQRSSIGSKALD